MVTYMKTDTKVLLLFRSFRDFKIKMLCIILKGYHGNHIFPTVKLLYIAATMLPPLVENPLYLMMHGYALQEIQY